jgi:hypothetical protein
MPAEPLAVPSDHGIGLHDDQGGAPVPPTLGEEDPKQSVRRAELRTFHCSPQHGQLLTEREIFQHGGSVPTADQVGTIGEAPSAPSACVILQSHRPENQPATWALTYWRGTGAGLSQFADTWPNLVDSTSFLACPDERAGTFGRAGAARAEPQSDPDLIPSAAVWCGSLRSVAAPVDRR